ncbi:MAG: hypothetical protein A3B86_03510 [Candidatus Yanofskybacteria bacterium RIFCSPHIGHO2_02_FULL_38_22b]|uniref:Uncharacterized protein n=1 Tax=Candidatus Yanofskybacteria bacterium RIFCSPHIGHO2_02_FULL_38_22b TaxID=1802673 RepID=A0A1F8F024_9BACT|nr:MAG: hypothetical protein A3B86_03510 [Candidatus Yanofskybacteria bacterium RIFCSPHIGHO2_02_FULL_38_22b]
MRADDSGRDYHLSPSSPGPSAHSGLERGPNFGWTGPSLTQWGHPFYLEPKLVGWEPRLLSRRLGPKT